MRRYIKHEKYRKMICVFMINILCLFFNFSVKAEEQIMGPLLKAYLTKINQMNWFEEAESQYHADYKKINDRIAERRLEFPDRKEDDSLLRYDKEQLKKLDKGRTSFYTDVETVLSNADFLPAYKEQFISEFMQLFNGPFSYRNYPDYNLNQEILTHTDPKSAQRILETGELKSMGEKAQYLILTNSYAPDQISSERYKDVSLKLHAQLMAYFYGEEYFDTIWRKSDTGKPFMWSSRLSYYECRILGYHTDSYGSSDCPSGLSVTQEDVLNCFRDQACLIQALPYPAIFDASDKGVCIPCEIAQKYDRVAFFDVAGGGHGAETYFLSDCIRDKKFRFPKSVQEVYDNLSYNRSYDVNGSIRFVIMARDRYQWVREHYSPDFSFENTYMDLNNPIFPVSQWATESYYNWIKYQKIMNEGIGFIEAYNQLKEHYKQVFGVSSEQAARAAQATLVPPGIFPGEKADLTSLNYLILSGAPLEQIKNKNFVIAQNEDCDFMSACFESRDYSVTLDIAVARPDVMAFLLEKCEAEEACDRQLFLENKQGHLHKNALMYAAQYNFLESARFLLDQGIDINAQTEDSDCWSEDDPREVCVRNGKRTALMYAVQSGHYEMVRLLLEKGADIGIKDSKGMLALDYLTGAAPFGNPKIEVSVAGGFYPFKKEGEIIKPSFTPEEFQILKSLLTPKQTEDL